MDDIELLVLVAAGLFLAWKLGFIRTTNGGLAFQTFGEHSVSNGSAFI